MLMAGGRKMAEGVEVSWDEAVANAGFVTFEEGTPKIIRIINWKLIKVDKFKKEQVEFQADCIEEDGEKVDKQFTTVSNRLKTKLRTLLEDKTQAVGAVISVIKVGDKFDTQYSVKLVEDKKE